MPNLKQFLVEALHFEEIDVIEPILYLIKQFNHLYLSEDIKELIIKLLNRLLDESIVHAKLISNELMGLQR